MSDDKAFFEELQMDFLNESAFMLDQYEEFMMRLENSEDPVRDLTDIFRVAHSVKGGAAAVGLTELSSFAHVMEDLLDLLRSKPELVDSTCISLLLQSGDELKNRVHALQNGSEEVWNPQELKSQLIALHAKMSGKPSKHAMPAPVAADPIEEKVQAPDDFFEGVADVEVGSGEDHTNHELLAELLAQLSPEDRAEFEAQEAAQNSVSVETSEIIAEATPTPAAAPSEPAFEKPALSLIANNSQTPAAPAKEASASTTKSANPNAKANSVIKVDTGRVDSVLDAVGELVVLKNQLVHDDAVTSGLNLRLEGIVDQLDKAVRELYEKTLSIRMTPLRSLFLKIQRIVRDVSLSLDKPVDLQLIGDETEVDRTVFELLGDPLVHLVRNSMDHGVEPAPLRKERSKSATAKVIVSAKQSGGNVIIEISDDGGGINREKVLNKAIERGFVPAGVDPATIPDEQVFQYILQPGFSTADKISDLSGRGVGLDVVKSNLEKINGKISITSKWGVGTTFRMTIPLSTAITDGIIVGLGGSRFILPIHNIREIVRVQPKDYTEVTGSGKIANVRGALIPVLDMTNTLGNLQSLTSSDESWVKRGDSLSSRREESMLVIVETARGEMALPVDDVLGQAQVVVKPIVTGLDIPEVAGAAILGDGKTVLILEPSALVNSQFVSGRAAA